MTSLQVFTFVAQPDTLQMTSTSIYNPLITKALINSSKKGYNKLNPNLKTIWICLPPPKKKKNRSHDDHSRETGIHSLLVLLNEAPIVLTTLTEFSGLKLDIKCTGYPI